MPAIMGKPLGIPTVEDFRAIDAGLDRLSAQLREAIRQRNAMQAALEECVDYFDDRADCDHDGERFIPNAEMTLLAECRKALGEEP